MILGQIYVVLIVIESGIMLEIVNYQGEFLKTVPEEESRRLSQRTRRRLRQLAETTRSTNRNWAMSQKTTQRPVSSTDWAETFQEVTNDQNS
jgi:hypothetical protein